MRVIEGAAHGGRGLRIPVNAVERMTWEKRLGQMSILQHLGVQLDLSDDCVVRLHLKQLLAAHQGGLGTDALNGAMIAAMMDCAMSVAGILHFRGKTCGTVQLSIQFMKPVRMLSPTVECFAVRKSPSMVFLEASLSERQGRSNVAATGVVGVANLRNGNAPGERDSNWLDPVGLEPAQRRNSSNN